VTAALLRADGFFLCHSERSEESRVMRPTDPKWILRCAQNDKLFFRHVMNFFTRFFARACKKFLKKKPGGLGRDQK